jgi:hypothetical protein
MRDQTPHQGASHTDTPSAIASMGAGTRWYSPPRTRSAGRPAWGDRAADSRRKSTARLVRGRDFGQRVRDKGQVPAAGACSVFAGTICADVCPGSSRRAGTDSRRLALESTGKGLRVAKRVGDRVVPRRGVAARYCPGCGAPIPGRLRGDAVYCSAACRARHWRWVQSSRSRVRAIRGTGVARASCPECGSTWVVGFDRRANAVYCSHRCRTRAWRRNRSQ